MGATVCNTLMRLYVIIMESHHSRHDQLLDVLVRRRETHSFLFARGGQQNDFTFPGAQFVADHELMHNS